MSHKLHEEFVTFLNTKWDNNNAYTLTDFASLFNIDIRLARYHLMKLVDMGELAQLKIKFYNYETYYVRWFQVEPFVRLPNVTIITRRSKHVKTDNYTADC